MRLLGNRVIIEPLPAPKHEGNIFLPETIRPRHPLAYIRALGQPRIGDFRTRHAGHLLADLKVGDLVRYNTESGGHQLDYHGAKCLIISTLDVQAIISEKDGPVPLSV